MRHPKGALFTALTVLFLLISVNSIAQILNLDVYLRVQLFSGQYLGLFLGLVLCVAFIIAPFNRKSRKGDFHWNQIPWYDYVLSLLGLGGGLYLAIFFPRVFNSLGNPEVATLIAGGVTILLLLEATRRFYGWTIVVMVLIFIVYGLNAGLLPGILKGISYSPSRMIEALYVYTDGILGIPTVVAAGILLMFMIFGSAIFSSGGGGVLSDLASAAVGRYRGGTAKASVVASSLVGAITGSPSANAATVGVLTIPLMKQGGYKSHVAAAVEAVSSTGSQIMPPVLGSTAFVLAQFLNLPYITVALASLTPAILYYICVFAQVDLEAGKNGLKGLRPEQIPSFRRALKESYIVFVPLLALVFFMLVLRFEAALCSLYAFALLILISQFRKATRINHIKIIEALRTGAESIISIAIVCAAAGVIIGVVSFSGLGTNISGMIVYLSRDIPILLLILTAVVCIILGMGIPVTPAYILVAILVAPAIIKVGFPPLAAHFFVFYYAILSFITPPVAIASFVAAGIAGADPVRTGVRACAFGAVAFIVPFAFMYRPELLLIGDLGKLATTLPLCLAGIAALAVGLVGYLFERLPVWKRIIFVLGGVSLFVLTGLMSTILTLVVLAILTAVEWIRRPQLQARAVVPEKRG